MITTEFVICAQVILIHYVGDEKVYVPRPHKNAKNDKTFVPNLSETKRKIREKTANSNLKPQQVFDDVTKDVAEREDYVEREAVVAPISRKQAENIAYQLKLKKQVLRCEIFSTIEMGRDKTLGSFILKHIVSPFHAVILAEPAALKLANSLLTSAMNDPTLLQNLTYDTTFDLTNQYVSALVMKNIYIEGNPLFGVAYMIHERKFKEIHNEMLRTLKDVLKLEALELHTPIVADREAGIRWGIMREFPNCNFIVCTNHLIRDMKKWVKDHGAKTDDKKCILIILSHCWHVRKSKGFMKNTMITRTCGARHLWNTWNQSFMMTFSTDAVGLPLKSFLHFKTSL